MADLIPAQIMIGGSLPRKYLAEFLKHISEIPVDWDKNSLGNEDQLLVHVDDQTKRIVHLSDCEAYYGQFEDLEDWLREQKMPYARQSSAKYEYDAQMVVYNPEWKNGEVQWYHTPQDYMTILLDPKPARKLLIELDNLLHTKDYILCEVEDLIDDLYSELAFDADLDELIPPFEIV